jgi:hypothetical protein
MNRASSDSILSVYSDARAEYTKQLCVFLVPAYFQFFIDLLEKAKQATINEPKKTLWQFQTYLNEIHEWNMEKVNNEIHTIHTNSGCDYLEDLLTAVFIAHTKVLTAIRLSVNQKKVQITVPKIEHFLFKVLCESAKILWGSTYLFRDGISSIEKQQNYRSIEQLLNDGILQAIRSLMPVKSILKDFVNNDMDNDDSDDETEQTPEKQELEQIPSQIQSQQLENHEQVEQVEQIEQHNDIKTITEMNADMNTEEISTNIENTDIPQTNMNTPPINEIVHPTPMEQINNPPPQMIVIDDKPDVQFAEFDAVFDSDNPEHSDMIFEPKDGRDTPELEILDESGTPLNDDTDFDDIHENDEQEISPSDYEVLI